MALKGRVNQTIPFLSLQDEGELQYLRMLKDGVVVTTDAFDAAIIEGRGWMVNVGALSTPAVGGGAGGTVVDIDAPELVIGVPTGTSIRPVRIEVEVGLPVGAADDDEVDILVAVDQDKMNASTSGTATAETIYNMNTVKSGLSSACYANSEYTATMTDPVLDLELAHVTKVFELFSTSGSAGQGWTSSTLLYEPARLPLINGPAMVCIYWGGTKAASGFCSAQWLEYPTSRFE